MNCWKQSRENIFVAAHRGWYDVYPENTLEGFKAALDLGVDQLETDIRITRDGELVLMHDATVDRTTNGMGKVCDMTLAEIKELDAGIKKDCKYEGYQVPTMIEFMELVKDYPELTLDIELKEYPIEGNEEVAYDVCNRVLKILEEYGFGDRCVINTFSGKLHDYIQNIYGNKYKQHVYYPSRFLGEFDREPYSYAYCTCVFGVKEGEVSIEEVKRLNEETGVRIWAGAYIRNERDVDLAVELGAELITCNNPDEILSVLRKKGLHK